MLWEYVVRVRISAPRPEETLDFGAESRKGGSEVYAEEARVEHDIRALVNCIRARVSDAAKPFVHLGATSQDINDSARALQYTITSTAIFIPELLDLERALIALVEQTIDVPQIGRTHGQHAVPITFGFMVAGYVSRLGESIERIRECLRGLRGKFSGAVGAYNAASLLVGDPKEMEREILAEIGFRPAEHATQIVPPEPLMRFFYEVGLVVGIMADLADDMRHLARPEIGEVREAFGAEQVGSSTMPHKRSPIHFERVKGFLKQVMMRQQVLFLDQLSEHQRDGTNLSSSRTYPEILAYAILATVELRKAMQVLVINPATCARNIGWSREQFMAEPPYILLASLGHPDAYEKARQLALDAEAGVLNFSARVESDPELAPYLNRMTAEQKNLFESPFLYTGLAEREARAIAARWKEKIKAMDAE